MPCYDIAPYKHLQRPLFRPCSYTAHAAKHHTGLCRGVSCNCTRSAAHDTRPTQAAIIPPAPRWSVSQHRNTFSIYQIPPPRRTLYRSAQPPYYNKVYKGAPLLWIHARRCSRSQTMPAGWGQLLPCTDRWQALTRWQQYRPCVPAEWVSVSTCTGLARRRLDASHTRRLAIWHRSTVRTGILAQSTRRGSPAEGARRATRHH